MWRSYLDSVIDTSQKLSTPHDHLKAASYVCSKDREEVRGLQLGKLSLEVNQWSSRLHDPLHHAHKHECANTYEECSSLDD